MSSVQTALPILGRDESRLANAIETRVGIDTSGEEDKISWSVIYAGLISSFSPPTMTSVTPVLTLISIATFLLLCHHRSRRADTLERSRTVDALPSVAEAGDGLALVNVHALARVDVLQESLLAVKSCRTSFTGVTPCNTYN